MPGPAQSECPLIICQLIGGCKAHLARQLLSPWKEEPLGVCRLTGKVLTPGGRRGKPEQALAGNPHTRTLPHPVFLNPFLRRREVTGFKDTWNPSLWRRQVAASDCRSRLILRSGAPPPTPHPRVTLRPPPLCYGRGVLGEPLHASLPGAAVVEPRALGSL